MEKKSIFWQGKLFKKEEKLEVNLSKAAQVLRDRGFSVSYEPEQPPYAAIIRDNGLTITLHYTGSLSACGRTSEEDVVSALVSLRDCLEVSGCLVKEKGI